MPVVGVSTAAQNLQVQPKRLADNCLPWVQCVQSQEKIVVCSAGVLGHAESVGSLDYWIRLRIPMDQALRLFRVSQEECQWWSYVRSPEGMTAMKALLYQVVQRCHSHGLLL